MRGSLATVLVSSSLALWGANAVAVCPPLPPSIDTFPSNGVWVIDSSAFLGTPPEIVRLSSEGFPPTRVARGAQVGDVIPIELVGLTLTGVSPSLGPIQVTVAPGPPSLGRIERVRQQDPGSCDLEYGESFFDIFYVVELPSLGERWFNPNPMRIDDLVHELPFRNENLQSPTAQPIPLFDQVTGNFRGELRYLGDHADAPFPLHGQDCHRGGMRFGIDLFGPGISTIVATDGRINYRRTDPYFPGPLPQTIDTELLSMQLTGFDPMLGTVKLGLNPNFTSAGRVQSQPGPSSYPAESFFDIFFTVDSSVFGPMVTIDPTNILASPANTHPTRNIPQLVDTHHRSAALAATDLYDTTGTVVVGRIYNLDLTLNELFSCLPPPEPREFCHRSRWRGELDVFDPFVPGGCSERFEISGTFRAMYDQFVPLLDGRDMSSQLISALALDGASSCVGSIKLSPSPLASSGGQVTSLAPAENFPMESFFDVFVDVELGALGPTRGNFPLPMFGSITNLPYQPEEHTVSNGFATPLIDTGGFHVANLRLTEVHYFDQVACTMETGSSLGLLADHQTIVLSGRQTGGGLTHDIVRGDFGASSTLDWNTSFLNNTCLSDNGPSSIVDLSIPPPGEILWYLSRHAFGAAAGSYDDYPGPLIISRDFPITSGFATCP